MAFENDVFISYSRKDEAWARKLEQQLKAHKLNVYLDVERLNGGEFWEQSLAAQIRDSRSLVYLRSEASKGSDWVIREVGLFEGYMLTDPDRLLIGVNLEGEDKSRASLQQINDLKDLAAYAGGPDAADVNAWARVVNKIVKSVMTKDDSLRIAVALLTLTRADVEPRTESTLKFKEIQTSFGLDDAAVSARYPGTRLDWRPYGGAAAIRTLLDQLINQLTYTIGGVTRRCSWQEAPEGLWDDATMDEAALALTNAPLSLVVVDTLALKHDRVYYTMTQLREYLKHSVTAWILIPPAPMAADMLSYRKVVKQWSAPLLKEYFDPPIPPDLAAPHFGVYCGDTAEIQRLVRLAAGEYLARSAGGPKASFTQVGGK